MKFEVILTEDGSQTIIQHPVGLSYHSRFGARTESEQVYLANGLDFYAKQNPGQTTIKIFEMGFGTGLNALLAAQYALMHKIHIDYHTCELYPLPPEIYRQLYHNESNLLDSMHDAPWEQASFIHPEFSLSKYLKDIKQMELPSSMDVIFYDAFDPVMQPDLWEYPVFHKLALVAHPGSVLTTYSSKGSVRRNLETAGWKVEKLRGPAGKREVVRATLIGRKGDGRKGERERVNGGRPEGPSSPREQKASLKVKGKG